MRNVRHIFTLVMALCATQCHAQVQLVVVPDIAEAITRVIEADDFQKAIQVLGDYGYKPGYIDKPSGTLFFDVEVGIMYGYAYLCPSLEDRNKVGMIRIGSNHNLNGCIRSMLEHGFELSPGYKDKEFSCKWDKWYGTLTYKTSRREYEIEFRLRPYKH